MSKLLGIVGSPRKNGNTHVLVSQILRGAKEAGAEIDLLLLGDLAIGECDGCHACWKTGRCRQHDDMSSIYPRLIESDAIIFGTPIYWYGPTALIKAFIDRLAYFNGPANRRKIRGKSAALAIPFEESDPDMASLTVSIFEKSFRYLEMDFVGKIIAPGVTRKGEVRKHEAVMTEGLALGRRLAG